MNEKILVVEDEIIIATDIKDCLENAGYTVPAIAAYGEQAIEKVAELQPDLVLMDVMLKGEMTGVEVAEEILAQFNIPVVYLTAYSDQPTLQRAKTTQPFGYILKPFEETQLITTIEIAINRHRAEAAMRQALEKEKELREIKSRFISMISHEFRNPLSTIINSTELLAHQEYQLNEAKKHEYINHIQAAVNQLNQLLNDVLIIGKAEESKIKFNLVPLDLEKFCQDLVAEMQLSVGNKHTISFINRFYCQKLENSPVTPNSHSQADQAQLPYFDEKLLRQILTNLLSNAIKYSPQGGMINFDLFWEKEEVIFRIQDEGIGIPIADQEELFNSFHRGSNVGKIPGTGLGLAVVKHYVELLGGEIAFASKVGVGTTFIVTLPFQNKREMTD